jgi:hypothetical protein
MDYGPEKEGVSTMKSKKSAFFLTGLMLAFGLVAWANQSQPRGNPKPQWEYWTPTETADAPTVNLNKLGAEGWELVAVRASDESTGNFVRTRVHYYLKRAK